jgi:hypothetical protein
MPFSRLTILWEYTISKKKSQVKRAVVRARILFGGGYLYCSVARTGTRSMICSSAAKTSLKLSAPIAHLPPWPSARRCVAQAP